MEEILNSRRRFIKNAGSVIGGSVFLSSLPWLNPLKAQENFENDKVRIGIIGSGSRGKYLMLHLQNIPQAEIVAICDIYQPHLDQGLAMTKGKAKGYLNYEKMLNEVKLDAVVVASPLHVHAEHTIDALNAGIHVFCEKSMARTLDDTLEMVNTWRRSGKILQIGHQRMFNLKYLKSIERIKNGDIGKVVQIRGYWHRNNDWRRKVPKPELERFINWRLYKEYSCGVLTELASHQIQVANWIYGQIPTQIMASGHVSYWKDGREVPDNIGVVIDYPDGKKFLWDSVISCAHYGLEEEVQGDLGVMELEKGKQFWETPPPAPGILQMINDFEHSIFDNVPLGGASWVPETAANREGEYLIDEKLDTDGSDMQLEAFIRNIQTNTIEPQITIQGYYASLVTLLAFQADETNQIVKFPEKYIIPEKMI